MTVPMNFLKIVVEDGDGEGHVDRGRIQHLSLAASTSKSGVSLLSPIQLGLIFLAFVYSTVDPLPNEHSPAFYSGMS